MNHCLTSNMHIIFCLRAREKTKIIKVNGKEEFVNVGIQPIAEKNFVFEMTVSLQLDEKTHCATPIKVPEPLVHLFPDGKLITKEDGERIRLWNETGSALDPAEHLIKRSQAAAEQGKAKYREFVQSLSPEQKKRFPAAIHETNKKTAEQVERIPIFGSAEVPVQWPDAFDGPECIWNGKHLRFDEATGNYNEVSASHAA
jgi:hypothetical protein